MAAKRMTKRKMNINEDPLPPKMPKEIGTTPNVRTGNFARRVYPNVDRIDSIRQPSNLKTPPPPPSMPIQIPSKLQPVNAKEAAQLAKEIAKFNKTYAQYPRPVGSGLGNPDLRPPFSLKSGDVVYGKPRSGGTPDLLSGRTPEGGTRSLLEGLRNWIGGGPGRRAK